MDLGLNHKIALVTGGSKGLGLGTASALVQEGARVDIVARDKATLESTASRIDAMSFKADLSIPDQVEDCIQCVQDRLGAPDILIVNTGGPPASTFSETNPAGWQMAVNQLLMSAIHLIDGFLPAMKAHGDGRIVIVTSIAAEEPQSGLMYSNVLRAGLHGLVNALSREIAPAGVTINAVMPGFIDTDRLGALNIERETVVKRIPLGRIGTIEEFGALVTFLCSRQASYITGQSIACDGGLLYKI